MEKDQLTRKLAVILHADVVGSTSLIHVNETLAHERIRRVFNSLSDTIDSYGGLAHEIRGDALVAEFERASDAVCAALAFQAANEQSNSEISDEIRPSLRIGISLGEVVIADRTITGAGVVLAQRLEQLAEPGGLVVQGSVSETVPPRMPFCYVDVGVHELKGFEQPVRAFAAELKPGHSIPEPEPGRITNLGNRTGAEASESPSIAVLPFVNLSNDPEQDYFGDGIAEDISTALSKVASIEIISSHSTTKYKDRSIDIRQVGRELGVRFVLEGSIRKIGDRLRINVQLIETDTGHQRWAERYDRVIEDIFAIQDEITRKIVSELDARLRIGEQARLWSSGTENFEAWQCVRLSTELMATYKLEDMPEAMRLMKRATELDPHYAEAWALLSGRYIREAEKIGCAKDDRDRLLDAAQECIDRALEEDPYCAMAYAFRSLMCLNTREFDEAAASAIKSVELAPNHARCLAISAIVLNKCGQPERAIQNINKAFQLAPEFPLWFLFALGQTSRMLGSTEETIAAYEEIVRRDPDSFEGHVGLALSYSDAGLLGEGRASASEVMRVCPDFSVEKFISNIAYRDPDETEKMKASLLAVGLPD